MSEVHHEFFTFFLMHYDALLLISTCLFLRRMLKYITNCIFTLVLQVLEPLPKEIVKVRAEAGPVALAVLQVNLLIHSHKIVLECHGVNGSGVDVHGKSHIRVAHEVAVLGGEVHHTVDIAAVAGVAKGFNGQRHIAGGGKLEVSAVGVDCLQVWGKHPVVGAGVLCGAHGVYLLFWFWVCGP